MALWALDMTAATPIRVRNGPDHRVSAAGHDEPIEDGQRRRRNTYLIHASTERGAHLSSLVDTGTHVWDVRASPAPDRTYADNESGRTIVVRAGAAV
jgi:hypothetical protein